MNRTRALLIVVSAVVLISPTVRAQSVAGRFSLDVRGQALSEGITRAARIARIDVAFAPELVSDKFTHCRVRNADTETLLRCILDGSGLEATRLAGGAYLIRAERRPVPTHSAERATMRPVAATGTIVGAVVDDSTRESIAGAHVLIVGTFLGSASDDRGRFTIRHVPEGNHALQASSIGFRTASTNRVTVAAGDSVFVSVEMQQAPVLLSEIKIVAGYDNLTHRIAYGLPVRMQSLQVAGLGLGFLVSAAPGDMFGFQLSALGNLAGNGLRGVQLSSGVNATGDYVHGTQISALGNRAGSGMRGVQVSGLFNAVSGSLSGWQTAGISNLTWGAGRGAQIAGAANLASDHLAGMQVAGVMNVGAGATGLQASGVVNFSNGDLRGLQAAGAVNVSDGFLAGMQVAGALNRQKGRVDGVQVAGAVNLTSGAVHGVQIAGAMNRARKSIHGLQLSGLFNFTRDLHGAQIGIVNLADRSSGFQLGLFNYVRDSGLSLDFIATESGLVTTAVRSGSRRYPTYLGLSAPVQPDGGPVALTTGLGFHQWWSRRVFSSTDLLNHTAIERAFTNQSVLRQLVGVNVSRHIAVMVGPALRYYVSDRRDGRATWSLASGRSSNVFRRFSIGMEAGIRIYPSITPVG